MHRANLHLNTKEGKRSKPPSYTYSPFPTSKLCRFSALVLNMNYCYNEPWVIAAQLKGDTLKGDDSSKVVEELLPEGDINRCVFMCLHESGYHEE